MDDGAVHSLINNELGKWNADRCIIQLPIKSMKLRYLRPGKWEWWKKRRLRWTERLRSPLWRPSIEHWPDTRRTPGYVCPGAWRRQKWILFEVFQTFSSSLVATFFFFVYFTLLFFSFLFFDWFIHWFIFWFILFFKLFAIANSFYVGVFMWMSVWSPVGIDTAQLSNKRFPSWDLLSDKYYWRGWGGRQIRATLTYKRLLKKSAFCFNNSTNE